MGKCEYKIEYTDLEGKTIPYECEETALEENSNNDGNKYCIFHSKNDGKDIAKFKEEFKTFYNKIKDHIFVGFIFPKDFDFKNAVGEINVLKFNNAVFYDAKFSGSVDFKDTEFDGNVGSNFKKAKFKGDGDFNFSNAKFSGGRGTDFSGAEFSGNGNINFSNATFNGKGPTLFKGVIISGKTDFINTKFLGDSHFKLATFSGETNFLIAKFSGKTYFREATFLEKVSFRKVIFLKEVYFDWTNFIKEADFCEAIFPKTSKVYFDGKTFDDSAISYFQDLYIEEGANLTFDGVNLNRVRFLGSDLKKINFKKVYWNGRRYNSFFYFGRIKVFDEKSQYRIFGLKWFLLKDWLFWFKLKHELEEKKVNNGLKAFIRTIGLKILAILKISVPRKKERNHYEVYILYNQLLKNYEDTNRFHEAGDFFAGQMEMRRRGFMDGKIFSWILLSLYKITSEYGERPVRVLVSLLIVLLFFGLLYIGMGIDGEGVDKIVRSHFSPMAIFTCDFWYDYLQGIAVSLDIMTLGKVKFFETSYSIINENNALPHILKFLNVVSGASLLTLFLISIRRKFRRV